MSAYREPAPKHVCRFDVVRYPPPYHDIPVRRCTCGAYPPDPWYARPVEALLEAVVRVGEWLRTPL